VCVCVSVSLCVSACVCACLSVCVCLGVGEVAVYPSTHSTLGTKGCSSPRSLLFSDKATRLAANANTAEERDRAGSVFLLVQHAAQ